MTSVVQPGMFVRAFRTGFDPGRVARLKSCDYLVHLFVGKEWFKPPAPLESTEVTEDGNEDETDIYSS